MAGSGDSGLSGSAVWITGASSGIGEALSRELARRGCRLALFARREGLLHGLAAELRGLGVEAIVQVGDVREREGVEAAVREADDRFGGLDIVVLNAGIGDNMFVDDFDAGVVERIMATNYLGVVHGVGAVLPRMLARGRGTIVGISSVAGARGLPSAAPYCASKAAVTTFLESLRLDLRPRGIRVITVSPGFVRTPLTDRNRFPMPFLLSPEVAARRIVRGIVRGKRHVHFPRRLTVPTLMLRLLPVPVYDLVMRPIARRYARGKRPE